MEPRDVIERNIDPPSCKVMVWRSEYDKRQNRVLDFAQVHTTVKGHILYKELS